MPEVDGFEALSQLRRICPDTPVIMTTSNNQPGDATKARALGASAFAVKPVRRADLLRLVIAAVRPDDWDIETQLAAAVAAKETDVAQTKILVAEDSEDNRFLVEAYLKELPYALTFVENGLDALNTFESEAFDLVLMDIHMPIMDGLKATESIRALEKQTGRAPTPILALTADALLEHVARSHAAGCDGHLSKPISKEKLVTALENFRFVYEGSV